MVKKLFMTLGLCMICLGISAETLTVTQVKEKFGYADSFGKVVIKAQYEVAYPFENGMAKVCKGKKWGYINESGKAVIPVEYESIEPFHNGIARVCKGKKYGYIKEDGTFYIKPEWDYIGSFNDNGYLWVGKGGKNLSLAKKGLYHNDQLIVPAKYMSLGMYCVTDTADYTTGEPVIGFRNNEITKNFCRLSVTDKPYIWVQNMLKTIVFDTEGKVLVKDAQGYVGMPKSGWAMVKTLSRKGKDQYFEYNYLSCDGKGKKLLKKNVKQKIDASNPFHSCGPFNEAGYAMVGNGTSQSVMDVTGKQVSKAYAQLLPVNTFGFISYDKGLYGIVSPTGVEVVEPKYGLLVQSFAESDVLAAKDANTSKYGFVAMDGNIMAPFKYEAVKAYVNGHGYVMENGRWGIVDTRGNYLVQNKWADITPENAKDTKSVWVQSPDNAKWYSVNLATDNLGFSRGFDAVTAFNAHGRSYVKDGEKIGAVDTAGEVVLPMMFENAELAGKAMAYMTAKGKDKMEEVDAYRFNIQFHPNRHKLKLQEAVPSEMWDY